jgi:alkylation response protein AidB-like acyl-CoA dehydrogenase
MELFENAQEKAFRLEVREFVSKNLPDDLRYKVMNFLRYEKQDFVRWHGIIAAHGWTGPNWPREYGGTGWNAMQRKIFDEECFLAGAPRLIPHVNMITPVLNRFGTAAQKERFLDRIWTLEDWWCQGYSEPGAGSDLAGLKTRAERRGDCYVVNGQKTWTTWAHWADWMFCLVRTRADGKPQAGISFLLIDMKTPGITVRPIISIDGVHDINEVFLDNVEVPQENLVGAENEGWNVAKFLLTHERTDLASVGWCKRLFNILKKFAATETRRGRPLIDDVRIRDRIVKLEMELMAHEWTVLRVLSSDEAKSDPGPAASILKIRATEFQQEVTELLMECAGPYALPYVDEGREAGWQGDLPRDHLVNALAANYLDWRKVTIFGGTTEVQKNILCKTTLGL